MASNGGKAFGKGCNFCNSILIYGPPNVFKNSPSGLRVGRGIQLQPNVCNVFPLEPLAMHEGLRNKHDGFLGGF